MRFLEYGQDPRYSYPLGCWPQYSRVGAEIAVAHRYVPDIIYQERRFFEEYVPVPSRRYRYVGFIDLGYFLSEFKYSFKPALVSYEFVSDGSLGFYFKSESKVKRFIKYTHKTDLDVYGIISDSETRFYSPQRRDDEELIEILTMAGLL